MNPTPTLEAALVRAVHDDLLRQAERARLVRSTRAARTARSTADRPARSLRARLHLSPALAR